MDYIVVGFSTGLNQHYIELGKVSASSKEKALNKVNQSIWYNYYVIKFNQEKYDELKTRLHLEIKEK